MQARTRWPRVVTAVAVAAVIAMVTGCAGSVTSLDLSTVQAYDFSESGLDVRAGVSDDEAVVLFENRSIELPLIKASDGEMYYARDSVTLSISGDHAQLRLDRLTYHGTRIEEGDPRLRKLRRYGL